VCIKLIIKDNTYQIFRGVPGVILRPPRVLQLVISGVRPLVLPHLVISGVPPRVLQLVISGVRPLVLPHLVISGVPHGSFT
jgi:hypothetical protein